MLNTFESLLALFGDLTALTADEQFLAQSQFEQETQSNNLTTFLNDEKLLDSTLELYRLFKQTLDTMREVKMYNVQNLDNNAKRKIE